MHLRLLPALVLLSSSALAATPRANPLVTVPQTESTLSVLQPTGGKLAWLRIDPANGKSAVVAIVPRREQISWSFDGRKALLWTATDNAVDAPAALPLVEVTVSTGAVRILPDPPHGTFGWAGFDASGSIHGFTWLDMVKGADGKFHFDGEAYELPDDEGDPGLVNDYVWTRSGRWRHIRSTTSTDGTDDAMGIRGGTGDLGPTTADATFADESVSDADIPKSVLAKLMASTPDDPDADEPGPKQDWRALKTNPPDAYVRGVDNESTFWFPSQRVMVVHGRSIRPLEMPAKQTWTAQASVYARGPYVLIEPGDGQQARMFDIRTGQIVYRTRDFTCFWPPPGAAR